MIIGAQYVGLAVVSAFVFWLVTEDSDEPRSSVRGSSRWCGWRSAAAA